MTNIKQLAEKATPGPWFNRGELSSEIIDGERRPIADACGSKSGPDGDAQDEANGLYIAAADPTTILDLIARLEKAEARVLALEKKYEPTPKARIVSLKRAIAHHTKEIEWKHRDDVDHTVDSVLKEMAEKEIAEAYAAIKSTKETANDAS